MTTPVDAPDPRPTVVRSGGRWMVAGSECTACGYCLAVQPGAEAQSSFDGMSEGVAEVEHGALTGILTLV